jgi:hypothetical protein
VVLVNFIRLGLSGRWIQLTNEEERYGEIEESVKNIIRDVMAKELKSVLIGIKIICQI